LVQKYNGGEKTMKTKPTTRPGECPNLFTNGIINYTTLHLKGEYNDQPQRIVAAFYRDGVRKMEGGLEVDFCCQFAFCSPQEGTPNKNRGQYIAARRLIDNGPRGRVTFSLPESFTGHMVRDALKRCAIEVAKRKHIRWLNGYTEDDLA
jgi:hypothetical protein